MNDDTVSRQAVLDCVTYDVEYTIERIKALPPLQSTCNKLATDCISRQDALNIRFSDAINEDGVLYVPLRDFTDGLKALPPAQQNIIRCEDCEHYIPYDWMFGGLSKSNNINNYSPDEMVCLVNDSNYPPDGFCSKAERRTDG